jgi:hypothetical protein
MQPTPIGTLLAACGLAVAVTALTPAAVGAPEFAEPMTKG